MLLSKTGLTFTKERNLDCVLDNLPKLALAWNQLSLWRVIITIINYRFEAPVCTYKPDFWFSSVFNFRPTLLWFQANSNCADAKTSLEFLCKDLSSELAHFDWRKEVELREILTEYSALRSEHFEKVLKEYISIYLNTIIICRQPDILTIEQFSIVINQNQWLEILTN